MRTRTVIILLAAGGALAAWLVTSPKQAGDRADAVLCVSNLREIYGAWLKLGAGVEEGLKGKLLICPNGPPEPQEIVEGQPPFEDFPSSYELVPWKLPSSARVDAILAFDRGLYHCAGRHVVFTDGSVRWLEEEEFQTRLEADRRRLGEVPPGEKEKRP